MPDNHMSRVFVSHWTTAAKGTLYQDVLTTVLYSALHAMEVFESLKSRLNFTAVSSRELPLFRHTFNNSYLSNAGSRRMQFRLHPHSCECVKKLAACWLGWWDDSLLYEYCKWKVLNVGNYEHWLLEKREKNRRSSQVKSEEVISP